MKDAFTLIEVLVVIILMVVVLSVVTPMGSKIFNQFKAYTKKSEDIHLLHQEQAFAFIKGAEKHLLLNDVNYTISPKGVLTQ